MTGIVNKIIKHSFVDGPGNRAVVFMQECNFRCFACHNPYTLTICSNCGICVPECKYGALTFDNGHVMWNEDLCQECDACIQVCPNNSSPHAREMTALQVWNDISSITPFISGVTASGGEPTLQISFLIELFEIVKKNSKLTTLIETNGYLEIGYLEPLLPVLDFAMVDLKAWNNHLHQELTGSRNDQILNMIKFLAQHDKILAVRHLVLPGYTNDNEVASIARFIKDVNSKIPFHLLRFRPHGTRGIAEKWEPVSDETIDHFIEIALRQGLENVERSL